VRDALITRGYIHAFVSRLQSAHKADCRRRGGLSNFGTFWSIYTASPEIRCVSLSFRIRVMCGSPDKFLFGRFLAS
jgi:hypothetical protein